MPDIPAPAAPPRLESARQRRTAAISFPGITGFESVSEIVGSDHDFRLRDEQAQKIWESLEQRSMRGRGSMGTRSYIVRGLGSANSL